MNRAKWVRGGGGMLARTKVGETNLRNDRGNMCCLGHIMLQLGYQKSELEGKYMPVDVIEGLLARWQDCPAMAPLTRRVKPKYEGYRTAQNTQLTVVAVALNDDSGLGDEQREEKLTALFKRKGYTLTFKGRYLGGKIPEPREDD